MSSCRRVVRAASLRGSMPRLRRCSRIGIPAVMRRPTVRNWKAVTRARSRRFNLARSFGRYMTPRPTWRFVALVVGQHHLEALDVDLEMVRDKLTSERDHVEVISITDAVLKIRLANAVLDFVRYP